jgi:DUF1680 family protein
VTFTVTEVADGGMPFHVRIPGWARSARVSVNGEAISDPAPGQYAVIDREWQVGDTIEVLLPMPVRILRANRLAEEITNQVAVQRGPVVYCLESSDVDAGIPLERLALRRHARLEAIDGEVQGHRLRVIPLELELLPEGGDDLYEDISEAELARTRSRLIPYFAWGNRGPSEMSVWLPVVW